MTNHNHGNKDMRSKNILYVSILNISFTIIEIIGGILTNSVAILSDALHDLGDSIALITSYIAEKQAKRPADRKRTFGYARISVFSAVFNAVVLIVGSIFILLEAIKRFAEPEPVQALGMIGIAVFGVLVNTLAYMRIRKGLSANESILSWHLLEDVIGWVAVLVGALVIHVTDFYIIDSILTIVYTLFILFGVIKSLINVGNILMQGVPGHINVEKIKQDLQSVPAILRVHDIHIWSLDGETGIFSGHIVVDNESIENPDNIRDLARIALAKHHIEHSTIEIESTTSCSGIECDFGKSDIKR